MSHLFVTMQTEDGEGDSFSARFEPSVYNDRWVSLRLEILPDRRVRYFVDDELLWTSSGKLTLDGLDQPIWLGTRSSSYGDALHDNMKIYEGDCFTYVGRTVGDFDDDECTNINDFLFLLDHWQQEVNGTLMGINDFLSLLDNWQQGSGC